jgi:AraC-like DNA-binding protein
MSDLAYTRTTDIILPLQLVAEAEGKTSVSRLLKDQDLPVTILDDPQGLLLYRDSLGIFSRAALITGERSIGMRAGLSAGVGDFGSFGKYLLCAPDLKQALIRARDALQFYESHSRVDIIRKGNKLMLTYRSREAGNVGWRHMAEMCVCLMIDMVRSFVGRRFVPSYICVDYRRSRWNNDLEDQFGIPVLFDRPATGIVFDRGLLEVPQIRQFAGPDIVTLADVKWQARQMPNDFVTTARLLLSQRMRSGRSDLDGLASKLGLSPRTVQRRLADDGLNFQNLLVECRKERAVDLLAEPHLTINEISDLLGYSSHSHFTRAFRQWLGTTPEKFRRYGNSKIVVNG